jgi:hypothetical protein
MGRRGKIKGVVAVGLPEPCEKFSPEFTRYERGITRVLKEEVEKGREG